MNRSCERTTPSAKRLINSFVFIPSLALFLSVLAFQAQAHVVIFTPHANNHSIFVLTASSQDIGKQLQLAVNLKSSGKLDDAEAAARQALADALTLRNRREISIATAQSILGDILVWRGQFEEAENLLRQSLTASEKISGFNRSATISTLGSLGQLYLKQGRLDEAKGAFSSAAERAEKAYGRNSPEAAEMINSVASASASLGQAQVSDVRSHGTDWLA